MRMDINQAYADITQLEDKDLDGYIGTLRHMRRNDHNSVQFSVNEITALLILAAAEKNSRSAAKQAGTSIDLSRETKALAEASLEQAKQSTKLSRWAMIVATVGVVATVVNAVIAIVEILT